MICITLYFQGSGKSKLMIKDPIYKSNIIQKISIAQDFLNFLLPNRKKYFFLPSIENLFLNQI